MEIIDDVYNEDGLSFKKWKIWWKGVEIVIGEIVACKIVIVKDIIGVWVGEAVGVAVAVV